MEGLTVFTFGPVSCCLAIAKKKQNKTKHKKKTFLIYPKRALSSGNDNPKRS